MEKTNRVEVDAALLDQINGGALGFNPESGGTYTMICQFSGNTYTGVTLANAMEIAKFSATVPNTPEGEQQIIDYAIGLGFIS